MGHKANITSLGFHPFGDFLASSSMDTNIKVSVFVSRPKPYVCVPHTVLLLLFPRVNPVPAVGCEKEGLRVPV